MYESANCTSAPLKHLDAAEDHETTSALELAVDASLQHHQTGVVNSTAQSGAQGRGGIDLSITGHHDHYSLASSTSSSLSSSSSAAAAAAASLSRHQRPVGGNSDCTTLQQQLEYVNELHASGPFGGANIHYNTSFFC